LKQISVTDAFNLIDQEESLLVLYSWSGMTIRPTMEQACDRLGRYYSEVALVKVEVDPAHLTKEEMQKIGVMRVPQLKFYSHHVLVGAITGQATPSDIYEKIISTYTT